MTYWLFVEAGLLVARLVPFRKWLLVAAGQHPGVPGSREPDTPASLEVGGRGGAGEAAQNHRPGNPGLGTGEISSEPGLVVWRARSLQGAETLRGVAARELRWERRALGRARPGFLTSPENTPRTPTPLLLL